ncbi:MFS transporter [Bacillus sp. FJAT-44742]|uniref:MFS transporter n=1 Tax=Bacillus sp. FJAT-44742 TaxID=2014005 RepID=UPI000C2490CD|nr:MFS transporter [Bacillus sp. FJAT-44742]
MRVHKGWLILFLIVLSVFACLGFGRFSFGAILPFMREGLHFDYRETGFIASSIFLGYLLSVTSVGYFVIRFQAKRVIIVSLLLIGLAMIVTANASSFVQAYIGCFFIGVGSGGAYVPSLGLIGQWFSPKMRGMVMGIVMAGAGFGIVFSGIVVPVIVEIADGSGWRLSWYILSTTVIIIAVLHALFLRNTPSDINLSPIASRKEKKNPADREGAEEVLKTDTVYRNKTLWFIGILYFLWGIAYLIFSTFLVDYLIVDRGFTSSQAGLFFAAAGAASIVSGFIWGSVSDKIGRMPALAFVYFIQFFMLVFLSISTHSGLILVQVLLYGITLWGVPTIMNASAGDYVRVKFVPVAMGFITLLFSIGQLISPIITGFLIDFTQSYLSAFLLSAVLTFIAGAGAVYLQASQRKQWKETAPPF